ncbi:MAG: glycoside hydrolase family 65 protein [Lentihominibacter sp.]|jgi:alpha,alpha-trehalose phosphorylase
MSVNGLYTAEDIPMIPAEMRYYETIFHSANGYLGVRYDFEEGCPEEFEITQSQYINGFYESVEMNQPERLYGLPDKKQTMVNIANTQNIRLLIDGEEFSMYSGKLKSMRLTLDTNKGLVERKVHWISPGGREIKLKIIRIASFSIRNLFLIDYEVTPVNFDGNIELVSEHNGYVLNYKKENDPRVSGTNVRYIFPRKTEIRNGASYIVAETKNSGLQVCSCVKNVLNSPHSESFSVFANGAKCTLQIKGKKGRSIRLYKYSIFTDSLRYDDVFEEAEKKLNEALNMPIDELYRQQRISMDEYWSACHVKIGGDLSTSLAMRFNLYQLNQSAGRDGYSNISPKGLSGDGYEGHYFWDSEMYIQPVFTLTNPEISGNLIRYRYRTLDKARENAVRMGHNQGALYPWRTISGEECSGYFPAGSAQYHINGDIAHSIVMYYLATGDMNFIEECGAEMLIETARLWISAGNYYDGKFHINNITGPDEYTCIVNNNYFTNIVAAFNMKWAAKAYRMLEKKTSAAEMLSRIGITPDEIKGFEEAAEKMYLPYDEKLKINPQDDSFLQKKEWNVDIDEIPEENRPLLMHYHPLFLYRHKICKQADTVAAYFINEDAQSEETMKNSFDFYEKITIHDSSLSKIMFSIVAARLGMTEKAAELFDNSAQIDLEDLHKNTEDGVHTANMAGCFMVVVYGFGGCRLRENGMSFSPTLPESWDNYSFKVRYRGSVIKAVIDRENCMFLLESGEPKVIEIYGKEYMLEENIKVARQESRRG